MSHWKMLVTAVVMLPAVGLPVVRAATPAELVNSLPSGDPAAADEVAGKLIAGGAASIKAVCGMITPDTDTRDVRARFVLSGLALRAGRSGSDADRKTVATAIAASLKAAGDGSVKAFLIEQLRVVGGDESVDAIAAVLNDKVLCDPAARALESIGTDRAEAALLAALGKVDPTGRVSVILALGRLQTLAASGSIKPLAADKDVATARAARWALASIGDPSARAVLSAACNASAPLDRARAIGDYLLLARRLGRGGKVTDAVAICDEVLKTATKRKDSSAFCAALATLVDVKAPKVGGRILDAMGNADPAIRTAALGLARGIGTDGLIAFYISRHDALAPEARAAVLTELARRGDAKGYDVLKECSTDADRPPRLAAIAGLAMIDKTRALTDLPGLLSYEDEQTAVAAAEALAVLDHDKTAETIATALPGASNKAKVVLLASLAKRKASAHKPAMFAAAAGDDADVRKAALKALQGLVGREDIPPLLALMPRTSGAAQRGAMRATLLAAVGKTDDSSASVKLMAASLPAAKGDVAADLMTVMAKLGGPDALAAIAGKARSASGADRIAAVHALAQWPDEAAMDDLIAIAKSSKAVTDHVLAMQGYLRLVATVKDTPDMKAAMYKDALAVARRADEKKLILAAVAKHPSEWSLTAAGSALDDPAVAQEACAAVAKIATAIKGKADPKIVTRALKVAKDPKVQAALRTLAGAKATRSPTPTEPPVPPKGFTSLFNGKDLTGWKGQFGSPVSRRKMTPEQLATAAGKADAEMRKHWRVENGEIVNAGRGPHLATIKDYGDFELLLEYKTVAKADSGVYLRGTPQVQIWDTTRAGGKWRLGADKGSGGLWNNKKHPRFPRVKADRPFGQWNQLRIKMIGERVTVHLNGQLVVDHVVMENYWERSKPIYANGPIELQTHGGEIRWRSIFIREIEAAAASQPAVADETGFVSLFNGKDLTGWDGRGYTAKDGVLICPRGAGKLWSKAQYGDFVLRLDFKLTPGANNGIAIRTPKARRPSYNGMEIQILDDPHAMYKGIKPYQACGSIYGVVAAKRGALKTAGQWNAMEIRAIGPRVTVKLNGQTIVDSDLSRIETTPDGRGLGGHPGIRRKSGHIVLLGHGSHVEFRNIRIKPGA